FLEAVAATHDMVPTADNSVALAELHWSVLAFEPLRWDDLLEAHAALVAQLVSPLDRMGQGYTMTTSAASSFYLDGALEQAARLYLAAAEHIEAAGGVVVGANIRSHGARVYTTLGAYERAEAELERAIGQAGSAGIEWWLMRSSHAWMLAHQGRCPEALAK